MFASDQFLRGKASLQKTGLLLTAIVLSSCLNMVQAQDKRSEEQVRRLRQQVQELQQAQSGQEAALAKANQEKSELSKQVGEVRQARSAAAQASQRAQAAAGEVQRLRKDKEALSSELSALKAELEKARAEITSSQSAHKASASTLTVTQVAIKGKEQQLQTCLTHNAELVGLGRDLLSKYVSVASSSSEPFLQLKQVALENLAQQYEDKLSQRKLKP
jgi:chromosome segregation ATPase